MDITLTGADLFLLVWASTMTALYIKERQEHKLFKYIVFKSFQSIAKGESRLVDTGEGFKLEEVKS
jgi:hypothetical protein